MALPPNARPDPDELLEQVRAESHSSSRGDLKVFFGYAAGVGKTYAMLQNAQRVKSQGRDVVVGYVEPHGRAETEALLSGLEILPLKEIEYRGVRLKEFDVDAALARRPEILLVDELAHSNAEGCRHQKRWQDIEEILQAGIDVWTTLNVQHIESLNDVIGQITGITVRETVPDQVFDSANDLELVDISPEDLLARLQAGKVYVPEQARRAIQSFFQRPNLTALRELSLRQAAQRIHTDVESARRAKAATQPWATAEKLLVCVGPSPTTTRVIRTAKRMATALGAPWLAVSVDLTGEPTSDPTKQQISQHFRLAERLGAETITLGGQAIAKTVIEFARARNVTKILIGKTTQPWWRRLLWGAVVDDVLDQSGDIDVYVIHGERDTSAQPIAPSQSQPVTFRPYLAATALTAVAGCLAYGLRFLHTADAEANTVMLFLAVVVWTAFLYGRGPAVFASIMAVLVFDFFFVPPYLTFAVSDAQYLVTFVVMLTVGLTVSTLTSRLRAQIQSTQQRERRNSALYQMGKQLSAMYGEMFLIGAAASKLAEIVEGEVAVYMDRNPHEPQLAFGQNTTIAAHVQSVTVAQWVIQHEQWAGAGTNTLPSAVALFLPLVGLQRSQGAIAIRVPEAPRLLDPELRHFLDACASQLALALERDQLAIDAANSKIKAEAEQVRSSLLSSVSHDLKTPLAAIAGASSSLLESTSLDEDTRRQLLETVAEEAFRLNRLLENILQMSKLDAGAATPNCQWHLVEELIGSAIRRTQRELEHHKVELHLPMSLPMIYVDGLLLEQVFVNLLENAARYTPRGTQITLQAAVDGRFLRIAVSDNGPGLPAGAEECVFDKFYRANPTVDGGRGSGLGLAICKAIMKAHGGEITAANHQTGGAEFVVRIPLMQDAPQVVVE